MNTQDKLEHILNDRPTAPINLDDDCITDAAFQNLDATLKGYADPGLTIVAKFIRAISQSFDEGYKLNDEERAMLLTAIHGYPAAMTESSNPERENETLDTACHILHTDAARRGVNVPALMPGCETLKDVYSCGSFAPYKTWPADMLESDWFDIAEPQRHLLRLFADDLKHVINTARRKTAPVTSEHEGPEYMFRREGLRGEFWRIIWEGRELPRVKNVKGMLYVNKLLSEPGHSFHCTELLPDNPNANGAHGEAASIATNYGTGASRRQLNIRSVKELTEANDAITSMLASELSDAQRDDLLEKQEQIAEALKQAKRDNRYGNDPYKKDRQAVTKAIRDTLERIRKETSCNDLYEHLKLCISTGENLSYTGSLLWQ